MGRVSSRTYRKKWLSISTESYQTLTSESEKPGPNSPKLGSTNQPRKSLDDKHELLKPLPLLHVQCPTFRYNAKARVGRGFTYDELKGAGLSATEAKQIGNCVDTRRRNKSAENLQRNVQRLNEYKQKLVIIKKGQTSDDEQNNDRKVMPLVKSAPVVESQKIDAEMKKGSVYQAFHMARANVKYAGQREKRAAARKAAEEEKKARKK